MKKLILSATIVLAGLQASALQATLAPTFSTVVSTACTTHTNCGFKNAEVQRFKEDLEQAIASNGEQLTNEIRLVINGIRASKADYVAVYVAQGSSVEEAEALASVIVEASDLELLALLLEIANEELANMNK